MKPHRSRSAIAKRHRPAEHRRESPHGGWIRPRRSSRALISGTRNSASKLSMPLPSVWSPVVSAVSYRVHMADSNPPTVRQSLMQLASDDWDGRDQAVVVGDGDPLATLRASRFHASRWLRKTRVMRARRRHSREVRPYCREAFRGSHHNPLPLNPKPIDVDCGDLAHAWFSLQYRTECHLYLT